MTLMSYLFFSSLKTEGQRVSTVAGLKGRGLSVGSVQTLPFYRDVEVLRFQQSQEIQELIPFRYQGITILYKSQAEDMIKLLWN